MDLRNNYLILVEDDEDLREALAGHLRANGYDVCEARDGAEALECLRRNERRPALILTDLYMPRMSGRELIAAKVADPRFAAIPVVVMSAGEIPVSPDEIRAFAFFAKPLDLDRLTATLAGLCECS